jgi:acyl-CoA thioesterase FadM
VELASGISQIGNSSFRFTGCALHKGEVQAAASSVMVVIDPATGRPSPIPLGLREQLEGWLI